MLVAPALVTNFWQLAAGPRFWALVRRLWLMMAGVCFGTWLGAGFLISAVPYIQALGLDRDELVQALALSPTVSALALGISLADKGALGFSLAVASVLAVVPALAGMYFGQWLRDQVSAETFRRIFFWALIVLAVYLALKSLR